MSDQQPNYGPRDDIPSVPPDTVTLGGGAWNDPKGDRRGRTWWYVGGGAIAAVALVAGGTVFAATHLRAQHEPGPAAGLPSDTLAYAALDLDPTAGQKIEAIKALRRFPALTEGMKIDPSSDLRKLMVQDELKSDGCGLDWSKDIEPWLGDDVGGALVPTAKSGPQPVAVLAVKDETAARKDLPKLLDCASMPRGLSIANGWAVIASSDAVARDVSASAKSGSLADDNDFKTWVDRTGDPGVATFYASKDAGSSVAGYLDKAMGALDSFGVDGGSSSSSGFGFSSADSALAPTAYTTGHRSTGDDPAFPVGPSDPFSLLSGMCSMSPTASGGQPSTMPGLSMQKQALEQFRGGAATLRFASGGFELETASREATTGASSGAHSTDIGTLPSDTALAYSAAGDPKAYDQTLQSLITSFADTCGTTADKLTTGLSRLTGLQLPQDLETLFGNGLTVAVSGKLDPAAFDAATVPTSDFPVGMRLEGDPQQIAGVLQKLPGADLQRLLGTTAGDGVAAVGPDAAYRSELLAKGSLGQQKAFINVVPHADRADLALYVSFDQLRAIVARDKSAAAAQFVKNVAPLSALGASQWTEDGISHGLVRLSTE